MPDAHGIPHARAPLLRSWRDLGSARLECVAGCSCPTLRLEHQWKHKSTQTALVSFEVRRGGAAEAGMAR